MCLLPCCTHWQLSLAVHSSSRNKDVEKCSGSNESGSISILSGGVKLSRAFEILSRIGQQLVRSGTNCQCSLLCQNFIRPITVNLRLVFWCNWLHLLIHHSKRGFTKILRFNTGVLSDSSKPWFSSPIILASSVHLLSLVGVQQTFSCLETTQNHHFQYCCYLFHLEIHHYCDYQLMVDCSVFWQTSSHISTKAAALALISVPCCP